LLAALPERERTVLYLRFFESMTQSQIAERIGVSQMHVSRILEKTLRELRNQL
jgi:RNA polymerase sigma-B factor